MPLVRVGKTILLFVHIPKTAGSSIETWLAARGQVCLVARRATGFSRVTPQHMERETYAAYIPASFYDHGFAILRDPMARLQSEFRHQCRLHKTHHLISDALKRAGGRAPGQAQLSKARKHLHGRDFDGWARAIMKACSADPYVCDNHIRPQADFIHPDHRLFDFDQGLEVVVEWIGQVCGLEPERAPLPHEKRTDKQPLQISDKTRALVQSFYAQDYAQLVGLRTKV